MEFNNKTSNSSAIYNEINENLKTISDYKNSPEVRKVELFNDVNFNF